MVFFRKRKLDAIRATYAENHEVPSINTLTEYMKPTQLWRDTGVFSQGYHRYKYHIYWCIPKEFIRGWILAKGLSFDEFWSSGKHQHKLVVDYYFGGLETK